MQSNEETSIPQQNSPTFEAPGRNGFVPERLLGRTGDDFDSTMYSTMNLEEVCLENIVMASLNQDILKKNFEIIISALRVQAQKLSSFYKHFNTYDDAINEIKEGLFQNDKKIEQFRDMKSSSSGTESKETIIEKETFMKEIRILKEKDVETLREVEHLQEEVTKNNKEISENCNSLEQKIETQGEAIQVQEAQNNDLQIRVNTLEQNISEYNDKIATLSSKYDAFESKIHLIESLSSKGNDGPDLSAIINQISLFRTQLKDYVLDEDFQKFQQFYSTKTEETIKHLKRIDPIDTSVKEIKTTEIPAFKQLIDNVSAQTSELELSTMKKITEIEEKLANFSPKKENSEVEIQPKHESSVNLEEIEKLIKEIIEKELARKVNMEDYYQVLRETENLKENMDILSNQIAALIEYNNNKTDKPLPMMQPPQPLVTQKETTQLKELGNKINDLESLLRKVQRESQELHTSHNALAKDFKETVKTLDEKKLDRTEPKLEKIDEILKKLANFENDFKNMKDKLYNFEKSLSLNEVGLNDLLKEVSKIKKRGSLAEPAGLKKEEINKLIEDYFKVFKKEFENLLGSFNQDLAKKSGFEDLWKSEGKTLEKLDELINLFTKKYCDKNETKKAFLYIENKINQLFAAVFGEKEENNDADALLAKKPVWSCASCDKELDKFQGKLGDYKGWAQFPPKNTSPERMGRFGVGYSRMIEDRKENTFKDWEKIKSMNQTNQESTKSLTQYNLFPELPKKKEKKNVF